MKAANSKASFSWYQKDKTSARDYILPALRLMNQGHCSFCDAFPLMGSSKEPIEHFQPKSDPRFHELAYVWSNLYYSCECCQSHKGEHFEDGLLQPDAPEYECLHYFEFDFTTGEMRPRSKAGDADRQRAEVTIRLYGLNESDRPKRRREVLRDWQRKNIPEIDRASDRDFLEAAPPQTTLI